jgi:uncharacterized protein (TIGR02001 family)
MAGLGSTPAQADIAANITVATSDIFRGESTSDNDAATGLEISYDRPAGLFAGASVTFAGGQHDPHFNSATQYVGYALQRGETTFEMGVIHRDYAARSVFDTEYSPHYFEGFVGVSRRRLLLRLYLSPNYLRDGRMSYYGEMSKMLLKSGKFSLFGLGGLTLLPPDSGQGGMRVYYDWKFQATRSLGRASVGLGIAGTNYPVFGPNNGAGFSQNKPRIFASISRAF